MALNRINGHSYGETLDGTIAADDIRGLGGNDILNGFEGNDRIAGGKGNDTIDGGDGNDRLRGGAGDDLLTGGAGNDRFTFDLQGGTDTITDFTNGADKLDVTNFNLTGFDALSGLIAQVGGDTIITMTTGEVIVLQNFVSTDLDAGDFRF